jgi:tetratricopeptide (TPR) repeat protein
MKGGSSVIASGIHGALLISALCCSVFPDQTLGRKSYVIPCINAILKSDYDTAFAITDSAIHADTIDPLPCLLEMTALSLRDIDFDSLIDTAAFFAAFRRTESRIAAYERKNGESSYSLLVRGLCRGGCAAFYLRLESYYTALHSGFKALDLLEDAWRMDTTNVEPLFLLGLYDYAKSELKKKLWWVLFWYPALKERAFNRLQLCREKSVLTGKASLFALAEMHLREGNTDKARPLLSQIERAFPKSRYMLWTKIKYLENRRLYYEASLACDLLAQSYAQHPMGTYNALVVRTTQAHMLARAGQKKDAVTLCRSLLKQQNNKRTKPLHNDIEKLLRSLDGN